VTPLDPNELREFRDWLIERLEEMGTKVGDRGLTMPPSLSADLVIDVYAHRRGELEPHRIELTMKEMPE
jgi:hypothetical protein